VNIAAFVLLAVGGRGEVRVRVLASSYAKCLECGEITPCRAASDADVAAI
jgi:hypothetical protein